MEIEKKLTFLISQPSSGSTLLQTILGQHKDIYTYKEGWISLHMQTAYMYSGINCDYNRSYYDSYVTSFIKENEDLFYDSLRSFYDNLYGSILARENKSIFLDKTPRYYLIIGRLKRCFPNAKFIFLIRHPLAVLSSYLKIVPKNKHILWNKELTQDLIIGPDQIFKQYKKQDPNDIFVTYENLLLNGNETIKSILNFLNLDYSRDLLNYEQSLKKYKMDPYGDNSSNLLKNTTPNKELADKWRLKISYTEIQYFKSYLKVLGPDYLDTFNYSYVDTLNFLNTYKPKSLGNLIPLSWLIDLKEPPLIKRNIKKLYSKLIK